MPTRVTVAVMALALLVAAGCGPDGRPQLEVGRAQAATPVSGSSQIVVAITNRGDGDDTLVEALTPAALGVEMHVTEIADGRATMRPLESVGLPAGETTRFRPGGLHLMMVVPDETVTRGGTFELTLRFDRSEDITVPVDVVSLFDLSEDAFDAEAG